MPTLINTSEATAMKSGLDSLHANPQHAFGPTDHEAAPALTHAPITHADRDAFSLRLQQHFHQYAVNERPFLLIAMRGDGEAAREIDFTLLYRCVQKLLSDQDDWLVDLENKRLIVLLTPGLPVDARRFFARLKIRLFETIPQQAHTYLSAISAITITNGLPFHTAEDLLTVALEEA